MKKGKGVDWEQEAATHAKAWVAVTQDLMKREKEVLELREEVRAALESRDQYAKDLHTERHRVAELRQKNDGQLAQVQALREQLAKAQEEIVRKDQSLQLVLFQARQAEAQLRAQLLTERGRVDRMEKFQQLFQTAPQTCQCSDPGWKRGVGEMIGDLVLRVGRLEKKDGGG